MENCVLKWFGDLDRMNDIRMAKRVYYLGVQVSQGRVRPTRVLMDGVKEVITNRGLTLEQARVTVHDRVEWTGEVW